MITIDSSIAHIITKYHCMEHKYHLYFLPKIKKFINIKLYNIFLADIQENNIVENDFNDFRKEGENESYLCRLIRNDLIEDFIIYYNRTNLSISSKIPNSIFETNLFLIKKEPTLIEYAAFFGSIQIFRYLVMNKASLSSSLRNYIVHSNNADLLHYLEEFQLVQVNEANEAYNNYANESIKCFHNGFANYILSIFR